LFEGEWAATKQPKAIKTPKNDDFNSARETLV
jgi:hypothetical protein